MNQENKPGGHRLVVRLMLILLVTITVVGCQDEKSVIDETYQYDTQEKLLLSIGETFAIVLRDPAARKFIKDEALRQFDRDYDILIQMILDKEVNDGKTFIEMMENASKDKSEIRKHLKNFPLLTIYVPILTDFSAESWDPVTDAAPKVAIDKLRDNSGMIPVVDFNGNLAHVSVKEKPTYPVLVLKENERVGINGSSQFKNAGRSVAYGNGDFTYYFLDEEMDSKSSSRITTGSTLDQKVIDAYNKSKNCSNCYHRDYIYYNISPTESITEGPFDTHFSEAITAISFTNSASAQSASDNWTEGNLEFHFVILFGTSTGISQVEKVHSTARSSFDDGSGTYNYEYHPTSPITIAPWRMDLYGNRWKISAFEYDPAGSTATTSSLTTTIGSNFKIDLSKIGIEFGSSSTHTYTNSTTITTTTGSDALGEAILTWTAPVLTSYTKIPFSSAYLGITQSLNTGSLYISIEPVRTY